MKEKGGDKGRREVDEGFVIGEEEGEKDCCCSCCGMSSSCWCGKGKREDCTGSGCAGVALGVDAAEEEDAEASNSDSFFVLLILPDSAPIFPNPLLERVRGVGVL